ncbi:MAG: uroporphyrinogen decarboxylase family protein [Planctomycetota bacterium]
MPNAMTPAQAMDLFPYDADRIALARARQQAVWEGREPDRLPILIHGTLTPEQEQVPSFNLKEGFYDPEKMFLTQLRGMIACANGGGDAIPSMRANLGCGVVPTMLGVQSLVFDDKMPWVREHLTDEQIMRLAVPDIRPAGDIARAVDYMRLFQQWLAGRGRVYCADIQGPFDTAHIAYGDAIFYAMYDKPDLVHHLLRMSTRAIIVALEAMKAVNGERRGESYHYNGLYMPTGGMKSSEDTTMLIAPDQIEVFSLPYLEECLNAVEGGYVHYCGKNDALFRFVMGRPCVRGVNFGNPDMHVYEMIMETCLAKGKVYYGSWPKREDENTYQAYFKRILAPLKGVRRGLVFVCGSGLFTRKNGKPYTAPEVAALWYDLQS